MSSVIGKLGGRSPALPGLAETIRFSVDGVDGTAILDQLSHGGLKVSDSVPTPEPGSRVEFRIPVGGALALIATAEVLFQSGSGFTARWLPGNESFERFLESSLGPGGR